MSSWEGKPIPYNGSGVFTVPIQFTPGTPILASEANANNLDFAAGFNNALPRDGQAAMTGVFFAVSGQQTLPGIAFSGDPDTGLWRSGANAFNLVTAGSSRLAVGNSDVTASVTLTASSGPPQVIVDRAGSSVNAVVQYRTTAGSIYAGYAASGVWALGEEANVATGGSRRFQVNAADGSIAWQGTATGNGSGITGLPIVAGTTGTLSVGRGGTGGTTQQTAREGIGAHSATNLTTGTIPAARVAAAAVTQHQAALSIAATQLTGTIASARVSGSYTGLTGTGALNAGSIASGFGGIDIGTSAFAGIRLTVAQGTGNGLRFGGATERIDYDDANGHMRFVSGNSVRLKINGSTGSVLFGPLAYTGASASEIGANIQGAGTTNPGGYSATTSGFAAMFLNRRASDGNIIQFYRQDDFIGAISVSTTVVNYNTTSDARAKENARDFDSGAIIDSIAMRQFDFTAKYGGGTGIGPLVDAEEAAKFPAAFTYDSENDRWLSDYSKFVPVLWHDARNTRCELRDLRTRVAALEAA